MAALRLFVYFRLGTDPRKTDQNVRGICELPHNNGKIINIMFACTNEENRRLALENGADMVLDGEAIENVVLCQKD